jgi:hypothetical protein
MFAYAQDAEEGEEGGETLINVSVGGANVEPTGVNCFDYYTFGSVVFDYPHAEKTTYKPGETASIVTTIVNTNPYPVVQGNVIAQVYLSNVETGNEQGSYLLDEFTAFDGLALPPNGQYELAVEWTIPEDAPAGEYYIALFFQEMHAYNLAGLPFLNHVYGAIAEFEVKSDKSKQPFYIDRNAVLLNSEHQILRHFTKSFEPGEEITYEVPIVNTKDEPLEVSVEYELYAWDQSSKENLLEQYVKKESLTIPSHSSKNASITFTDLEPGAYLLRIVAQTASWKNILDLRFSVKGAKGRFIFTGITSFPLVKNDSFTMFACFSNTTDWFTDFDGKVTLELKDKEGSIIASDSYEGTITPKIMAIKKDLVAADNYDELYLTATISDSQGNMHQQITKAYRLSDFRDLEFIKEYEKRKEAKPTPTATQTPAATETPQAKETPTPEPTQPEEGLPAHYIAIAVVIVILIIVAFIYMKKEGGK